MCLCWCDARLSVYVCACCVVLLSASARHRVSALSLMAQAVHRLDKEAAGSMLDVCTQVGGWVGWGGWVLTEAQERVCVCMCVSVVQT